MILINSNIILINYEDFENKDKNKIYEIIKFINKIVNIDIINRARKLKSFLFKINFNNISKIN